MNLVLNTVFSAKNCLPKRQCLLKKYSLNVKFSSYHEIIKSRLRLFKLLLMFPLFNKKYISLDFFVF